MLLIIRRAYIATEKWPQYARDHWIKEEIQQITENMPELEIPTEEKIHAIPKQGEEYKKLLTGYETWSSKNLDPVNRTFSLALVVALELVVVGSLRMRRFRIR